MIADGRVCCREHGIINLKNEMQLLIDFATARYREVVQMGVFISELQKMLADPEYCSELLE